MYRRERSGGASTFLVVIVLGIIAGIAYLSYEHPPAASPERSAPTPADLPVEPAAAPLLEPTQQTGGGTPIVAEESAGASFYAPSAGISGQIVETYLNGTSWDVSQLGPNVGHLEGTGWLDVPGNVVLAGHVELVDGRPGVFAKLQTLHIGDQVIVTQQGRDHVYEVRQIFTTDPTDLSVIYPTPTERLTLITCSNYDFLQDRYDTRYVVIAERMA